MVSTGLQPAQQVAAMVTRLGGTARELLRCISLDKIQTDGVTNGVVPCLVGSITAGLRRRLARLVEKSKLADMTIHQSSNADLERPCMQRWLTYSGTPQRSSRWTLRRRLGGLRPPAATSSRRTAAVEKTAFAASLRHFYQL